MAKDETTSSERPERKRGRRSRGAPVKVSGEPLVQVRRISDEAIASIVERALQADWRQGAADWRGAAAALSRFGGTEPEPEAAELHALVENEVESRIDRILERLETGIAEERRAMDSLLVRLARHNWHSAT